MAYAMNADIATQAIPTRQVARVASTKIPFFTRLVNAMIESRMRSAELELRRHSRFLEELESGKIDYRSCETFERSA